MDSSGDWTSLQMVCVEVSEDEMTYEEALETTKPYLDEINNTTVKGTTPLHFAVLGKNDSLVRLLIKNGAKFVPNQDNETPLHWAAVSGSIPITKRILRFISTEDISLQDANGKRAIDWAIENEREDIAALIKSELKRKALKRLKRRHSAPKERVIKPVTSS